MKHVLSRTKWTHENHEYIVLCRQIVRYSGRPALSSGLTATRGNQDTVARINNPGANQHPLCSGRLRGVVGGFPARPPSSGRLKSAVIAICITIERRHHRLPRNYDECCTGWLGWSGWGQVRWFNMVLICVWMFFSCNSASVSVIGFFLCVRLVYL